MRALISGKFSKLPDFQPHPKRTLVRVEASYYAPGAGAKTEGISRYLRMVKKRLHLVPEVLYYDGFRSLYSKARHMLLRERLELDCQVASFTGWRVAESKIGDAQEVRVFGISPNHPGNTDLVLARPEFVLAAPKGADPYLLALAWPGMLSMSVASEIKKQNATEIKLLGMESDFPVLSWVLRTLFGENCVSWSNLEEDIFTECNAHKEVIVIVTQLPDRPQAAFRGHVLGFGYSESAVKERLPNCSLLSIIDNRTFLRDRYQPYLIDLFYDDTKEIRPWWLSPNFLAEFGRFVDKSGKQRPEALRISSSTKFGSGVTLDNSYSAVQWFRFDTGDAQHCGQFVVKEPDQPQRRSSRCGVGLIGGGRWALGMIVRQMVTDSRVKLRGVCDRRPEIAYLAARSLPFAYHTTDPEAVLNDKDTNIIVIAPYHGVHAEFAIKALECDKHCFLEKPPVITEDQLQRLASAARKSAGSLYVGYNRRFAKLTQHMLRHLAREPGAFFMDFVMRSLDLPTNHWYYWPSNGSRIIANCCHMIDLSCQIADGAKPVSVIALPGNMGRIDRNVAITIRFEDDSLAVLSYIDRGRVSQGYYQRYLVARGAVFCEIDGYEHLRILRDGRKIFKQRVIRDMGHRQQIKSYLNHVLERGESPVSLEAILTSALIVLAADYSARRGGVPVVPDHSLLTVYQQ